MQRVADVVVRQRRQDHAQWIGLVVERCRARREHPLAGCTTPELHDLKFFPARSSARQHVAAAVRARVGYLGCVRDACDAGKWPGSWWFGLRAAAGHTPEIAQLYVQVTTPHANRKDGARKSRGEASRMLVVRWRAERAVERRRSCAVWCGPALSGAGRGALGGAWYNRATLCSAKTIGAFGIEPRSSSSAIRLCDARTLLVM